MFQRRGYSKITYLFGEYLHVCVILWSLCDKKQSLNNDMKNGIWCTYIHSTKIYGGGVNTEYWIATYLLLSKILCSNIHSFNLPEIFSLSFASKKHIMTVIVDKNCMLHCFRLQDFIIFQGFHIFRLQMTKIKLNQKKFPDIKKINSRI